MAFFEVEIRPSTGRPFERRVSLSGTIFYLQFVFNARCQYWTLHVLKSDRTPILNGKRCNVGQPLLIRCSSEDRPVGQLWLVDSAGPGLGTDPGPYDLGTRIRLIYETEDAA